MVYNIYKNKEFNLRNLVNLEKVKIANFIEINENIIIDFIKEKNNFKDIFISFNDEYENQIFAKSAILENNNNEIIFNLFNGFKLSYKDPDIEKLQFETYKFKFPSKKNEYNSNVDKNSITIYQSLKDKDYRTILEKIIDTLIILTIIYFFYFLNIKKNDFSFKNILIFLIIIISIIIIHNVIKNIDLSFNNSIIIMVVNILLPYSYIFFEKRIIK